MNRRTLDYLKSFGTEENVNRIPPSPFYGPGLVASLKAVQDGKQAFEGQATRSTQKIRYDLLTPCFMPAIQKIAERATLGASRHGDRNWESGGPEFVAATKGHLMAHVVAYLDHGNEGDDNLAAILWNAAVLVYFEGKGLK